MTKQIIQGSLTLLLLAGSAVCAEQEFFACSETGTGSTYFKVCASNTGNITLLKSPWGMEHIRVAMGPGNQLYLDTDSLEGFDVCRWDPEGGINRIGGWEEYFDFGDYYPKNPDFRDWNWRWNAPYKVVQPNGANKFPLQVFRKTEDDVFEMKQEFAVDSLEREITVKMTLHNRSGKLQQEVRLIRGVSLNIDNTSEDGLALFGKRSVVQYDSGPPDGGSRDAVSLAALTTNYPYEFVRRDFTAGWDTGDICVSGSHPKGQAVFSYGTAIGGISYVFGNLPAGASRTVQFAYRAF